MDTPVKQDNGRYPRFSFPGGYEIFYVDKSGLCLCSVCANDEREMELVGSDVNWECAGMTCDICDSKIESAYGEDEYRVK